VLYIHVKTKIWLTSIYNIYVYTYVCVVLLIASSAQTVDRDRKSGTRGDCSRETGV